MSSQVSTMKALGNKEVVSSGVWRAGVITALIAAIVNVVIYFIGNSLVQPLQVVMGGATAPVQLPLFAVVIFSVVPLLGAMVLLWLLGRFTARPFTIFTLIAVIFLLISFIPDLTMAGVSDLNKAILVLMHTVAGLTSILGLRRLARG